MQVLHEAGHDFTQARVRGTTVTRQYGLGDGGFVQIAHRDSRFFQIFSDFFTHCRHSRLHRQPICSGHGTARYSSKQRKKSPIKKFFISYMKN
jgi:hypothetical protein